MLDLFMFTDTLISYHKNKMTINYNSLINTVKELDDNDIINRYNILCNINNFNKRIIKMFEGEPSEKNGIPFDYTTLYDIEVILIDDNDNCIINSIEVKDD